MKARLQEYIEKFKNYWQEKNKTQKGIFIGSVVFFIGFMALLVFFLTRTPMVPLYSDLTPQETGSIKEALDARGIPSEIADGGTTILVPEDQVESLLVELEGCAQKQPLLTAMPASKDKASATRAWCSPSMLKGIIPTL